MAQEWNVASGSRFEFVDDTDERADLRDYLGAHLEQLWCDYQRARESHGHFASRSPTLYAAADEYDRLYWFDSYVPRHRQREPVAHVSVVFRRRAYWVEQYLACHSQCFCRECRKLFLHRK